MGRYFSCNGESAVSTCDPYYWDCKRVTTVEPHGVRATVRSARNSYGLGEKPPPRIRKFRHSELVATTGGFSSGNFLGKGSHGRVYRATLDGGRLTAAVKRAKLPAGANFYENEIEILSRVHGPRLVNLIGVCEADESIDERLIVVEYMPNGSLYDSLHGSPRPPGWSDRVRFALQVARAVRGLHEADPPIIHRDIKSSNVLIDGKWNARLGDFGLALRGHVEDVLVQATPPAGTLGYLDPAYTAPGDLSDKSDVFSFGILLLEIISGRKAIDINYSPPSIVDWALPLIKLGKFGSICDPRIGLPAEPAMVRLVAVLAAQCVRADARRRPTMVEAVERLRAVRERVRAIRVWGNMRQRHRLAWINPEDDGDVAVEEAGDDRAGRPKRPDRRARIRKVSDIGSVSNATSATASCYGARPPASVANHSVVRSRSVGSGSCPVTVRRRQAGHASQYVHHEAAVAVRLSKSRSVGAHASDYARAGGVFGHADYPVPSGD